MLLFYIIFGDHNPSKTGPGRRRKSSLQTTLPCFGLQYSISKKTRTTVSLSSMQGVFAESSLRKQAWTNPKEGRVGCLHQNIFTRKVTDIAFTSYFCNNHSHPTFPASLYLTSPRPRPKRPRVPYLMSSSPSSRVPKSQVPTHASRCPRPTFIHSRCHKNLLSLKFSIGSYYFYQNEGRDDNTEKKFSVGFSQ